MAARQLALALWKSCAAKPFDEAEVDSVLQQIDDYSKGDLGVMQSIVNWRNSEERGATVLMKCCENGLASVAQLLIEEYGGDVNAVKENGVTALIIASGSCLVAVCRHLVERGADVNVTAKNGWTPLIRASQKGHLDICKYLVEHGADVNAAKEDGWTPLMIASQNGHVRICKYLVEHGADVNAAATNGTTSLIIASQKGHLDICKYLVEHGADVNAAKENGATPLYRASQKGHLDICKYLVEHGADVNATAKNGVTSLIIASQKGHLDICKYLVEHGADVNAAKENGVTPLHIASLNEHLDVCKYLVEHGADVNATAKNGWTPLMIASQNGHVRICKYLVEHGADVNAAKEDGVTPLYVAGQNGHVRICKYLVEHGADVNAAKEDGWTPLRIASFNGHVRICKYLVEHGADVNAAKEEMAKSQEQDPYFAMGKLHRLIKTIDGHKDSFIAMARKLLQSQPPADITAAVNRFQRCQQVLTEKVHSMAQDESLQTLQDLPSDVKELISERDALAKQIQICKWSGGQKVPDMQLLLKELQSKHLSAATKSSLKSVRSLFVAFLPKAKALFQKCVDTLQADGSIESLSPDILSVLKTAPESTERIDATFANLKSSIDDEIARVKELAANSDVDVARTRLSKYLSFEELEQAVTKHRDGARELRRVSRRLRHALENLQDEELDHTKRQQLQQEASQLRITHEESKAQVKTLLDELQLAATTLHPELYAVIPDLWAGVPGVLRRSIDDYDRSDARMLTGGRHKILVCKFEGQPCVLKGFVVDKDGLRRVKQQLKMWMKLREGHAPHVLPVEAFVLNPNDANECYIHVPFMKNGDLSRYLAEHEHELTSARRQNILHGTLVALNHIHLLGIIHMDIKLDNVLMDDDCNPLISDFEISQDVSSRKQTLTQPALSGGTLEYMAPEISDASSTVTNKCDMYSFGVLMEKFLGATYTNAAARDLIAQLKQTDPAKRPSAAQALQHAYFKISHQDLSSDMVGPLSAPWRYADSLVQMFQQEEDGYFTFTAGPSQSAVLDTLRRMIVEAKPSMKPPKIVKATLIHDPHKLISFYGKMKSLAARYTDPAFHIDLSQHSAADLGQRVLEHICNNSDIYPPLATPEQLPGPAKLHFRRAYHGVPSMEVAEKILKGDFAALAKTDGGWFGAGLYFTLDLAYALKYARHDSSAGGKVVLMCDVVFGNPYPMTDVQSGCAMRPGSDAHIAVVKLPGTKESIGAAKPVTLARWDKTLKATEIVLVDTSHILIRAVLVVKK